MIMSYNYMRNEVVKYWEKTNDLLVAFEDFNGQIQKHTVHLPKEDIDTILNIGITTGIKNWCDRVDILEDKPLGTYYSEQVSRDGSLIFHDKIFDRVGVMTLSNFLQSYSCIYSAATSYGLSEHCIDGYFYNSPRICDYIIQFALFEDIPYFHAEETEGGSI